MFNQNCAKRANHPMAKYRTRHAAFKSSGNSAFDAYKADTLRRLEEEQENFEAFLQRLRESKDKAEFDQFMEERARKARDTGRESDDEDGEASPSAGY